MSDLFDLPFEEEDDEQTLAVELATNDPRPTTADQPPIISDHRPATARRILSVTELTVRVRDLLETELFEVWVEGELSNCRLWQTGHLYFTLKDQSAQIRGVIFRSALRYLKFKPADGLRVVARGKISVYEPKGEYQIVCEHLEPQGLGALQLAFEQLKKRLQGEGLFDAARKRPLPSLPRKIGIVTSLDGAAVRDIINVLRRRYSNAHLVIRPTRVQGEGAAGEIARGVKAIARVKGVDVVIVGRGGGSIEDLWAFNEEIVARAIAGSPVPIISAVGHETDFTIADFVADLRAPTPSAAAELVVSAKDDFCGRIDRLQDRLRAAARARLQTMSRRVHVASSRPAFSGFPGRLAMRGRHVAELSHGVARVARVRLAVHDRRLQQLDRQLDAFGVGTRLASVRARLAAATGRLGTAITGRRHRAAVRLGTCAGRLESLSPLAVLGRGYAVAWNADRTHVLRDASRVARGDVVHVTLSRGELTCEVREKNATTEETEPNGGTRIN